MKIDIVRSVIAVIIAALIGWGLSLIPDASPYSLYTGLGGGLACALMLFLGIGCDYPDSRMGVNIKMLSMLFMAVAIVLNVVLSFFEFSTAAYCIPCGLLLVVYLLAFNGLYKAANATGSRE